MDLAERDHRPHHGADGPHISLSKDFVLVTPQGADPGLLEVVIFVVLHEGAALFLDTSQLLQRQDLGVLTGGYHALLPFCRNRA